MEYKSSKLDCMDINLRLGQRIRQLRDARKLSLEALAERCGVSRSNISLIERGQSSPTATVLDKLSVGLGVSLASLFEAPAEAASPLARRAEQVLWTDPASGYQRRNLSPAAPSPLQLVEVVFPPGARVAYDTAERDGHIHQQVWLIEGEMHITVGSTPWQLQAGDCLAMPLAQPMAYHNPGTTPARYLVVLNSNAQPPLRRPA
jgi:transcriptional regulator with XRE-family HTH domain